MSLPRKDLVRTNDQAKSTEVLDTQLDQLEDMTVISKRYGRAKELLQDSIAGRCDLQIGLKQATQILKWIEQNHPGYEDTRIFLHLIEERNSPITTPGRREQTTRTARDQLGMLLERLSELLLGNRPTVQSHSNGFSSQKDRLGIKE